MSRGFYKRRRGILEHLEAGAISLLDLAVHDYLNLTANLMVGNGSSIPPGVCITSAVAIHATCPSQISERAIQRSLQHLKKIGWIKSWNVPGKRGNYPILVCRASVHDLSGKEYRVNGEATSDWKQPVLIPVAELSPDWSEADANLSGDREVRIESKSTEKKKGAPASPSLSFSGQHFSVTQKQDALLGEAFPWVNRLIEYRRADSWLEANPCRRPKKSSRFLHNWFSRITEAKGVSGNGKPTLGDNLRTTLGGYRQSEAKPS